MEDKKDILAWEYRKSPVFAGYHIFTPASLIERYMEDAIFIFHETKKDDPIMATTNLFGNIINIQPFEDGNLSLNFSSCFDKNEMLFISSHFMLLS